MSQGIRLIQAAIREENPSAITTLNRSVFIEDELPLVEFVLGHYNRMGTLPDTEVLAEHGYSLSPLRGDQPLRYYEDRVQARFVFNTVRDSLEQIQGAMENQDTSVLPEIYQDTLTAINTVRRGNTATLLRQEVQQVWEDYQVAKSNMGQLRGITLGWPTPDRLTLGAQGGDLIVMAARPGQGKTNLLLRMATAADDTHRRLLIVTMEMGKMQITRRWVGIRSGINPNFIRSGQLSVHGERHLDEVVNGMVTSNRRVYFESGDFSRSTGGIEDMINQFSPEMVYVDAAYLLSPEGRKKGYLSRWESISEVVRELKSMALRYNIPIAITVQFNRNQKNSTMKEPDLGDIAGSDSIPQDASIVLGIQRGRPPYQDATRIVRMMKDREGDAEDFAVNYRFSPVDFTEIPMPVAGDEESRRDARESIDWMV